MIIKNLSYIIITAIFLPLFAKQTMCYKEDLNKISQIQTVKLEGGYCKGEYTLQQMKDNNWTIKEVKQNIVNNKYSFIYIFSKNENINLDINLEDKIKATIIKQKKVEKENKIKKEIDDAFNSGKKQYINTCQRCHGEFANKNKYYSSELLSKMSIEEMQDSIDKYKREKYDNGNAFIMKPYATSLFKSDVINIFNYIQTIKK